MEAAETAIILASDEVRYLLKPSIVHRSCLALFCVAS